MTASGWLLTIGLGTPDELAPPRTTTTAPSAFVEGGGKMERKAKTHQRHVVGFDVYKLIQVRGSIP